MFDWKTLLGGAFLSRLFSALLIVILGVLAIRVVLTVLRKTLERSKLEKAAHSLILSLVRAGLYLVVFLSAASALGIDVTGIVALASVLTLALSLSLQNMASNVVGGFTILYNHSFHSGDFVEVAGQAGTVKEINMTYTVLITADNKMISIPNSSVVASQIVNYSAQETRRVEIAVSAGYDAPVQKVLDALVQAGTRENVLEDPAPQAVVTAYGDSAISYSLRLWVKTPDYWDVYFAVTQRVKEIFDEQGITMTYPHLIVHMEK